MNTASESMRLNQAQRFKLFHWISANFQDFNGKTDKDVAILAFESLGFAVSSNTICDIRTDPDIETTWRTSKDKEPDPVITSDGDIRILAETMLLVLGTLNGIGIYVDAMPEFGGLLDRLGIPALKLRNDQVILPLNTVKSL